MEDFVHLHFKGRKFYFYCKWNPNDFEIHATDGKNVWTGVASQQYISTTLCPKGMKASEYISFVREVILTMFPTFV
jgi:hypothetical protein